ncbi:porin [Psychromonas hadalis]|uniref:porin n=1 Tax=Psychromonas hadalis TaxID=211669 RepID=UPI0003B62455|nr:porin [Psychromonas hadalis]
MFKKTLVAAALAATAFGASAYEIGQNNDFSVEVYGVAAISVVNYNVTGENKGNESFGVENESRIGFRAGKAMTDSLDVFMQIESGYVDNTDWGHGGVSGGVLGFRDTFVGLKGDWGKVRFGRVLTPLYEIVDWPFSNPGLGSVFDWGGIAAHYDRQSNQIRYDAPSLGGFTTAFSVGTDAGKNGGGPTNNDSVFFGANARYSVSIVNLMAGIEAGSDFKGVAGQDNLAYILGAEVALPGGFGLAAAYKGEELDGYKGVAGDKITQGSYSVIAQYWNGPLGIKAGYAANLESETNGTTNADSDANTISLQVMGVINGFVPYIRVAGRTEGAADTQIVTRVGLEYGF